MGSSVTRFVGIEIHNKTQNVTLENPRVHFYSGRIINSPQDSVPPGSSGTCKFLNNTRFWGCHGLLAIEAESFTLAIYFRNPIDYNRSYVEMGLELSPDKVHKGDLEEAYNRMVSNARASSDQNFRVPFALLRESRGQAQLSAGPVKVTATMSGIRDALIKVEVEEHLRKSQTITPRQRT